MRQRRTACATRRRASSAWRAMEESLRRRGRELRVTVALDSGDEVGAFTDLRVSRGSILGFTDDTATIAAHRGIGLAAR